MSPSLSYNNEWDGRRRRRHLAGTLCIPHRPLGGVLPLVLMTIPSSTVGWIILAVALFMLALGSFAMAKLASVEV